MITYFRYFLGFHDVSTLDIKERYLLECEWRNAFKSKCFLVSENKIGHNL
jgi:hypothetical protein